MIKQLDTYTIIDLIDKLMGNIEWHGETNHDYKVLERLLDYDRLLDHVLDKYYTLISVRFRTEYTAQMLSQKAYNTLKGINEIIEEYLNEYKEEQKLSKEVE